MRSLWPYSLALLFGLSVCTVGRAQQPSPTYPDSLDGFQQQIGAIEQAYRAHDGAAGEKLIELLHVPDSDAWFRANFDPESVALVMPSAETYGGVPYSESHGTKSSE